MPNEAINPGKAGTCSYWKCETFRHACSLL